jgi:hypothetical protein
VYVCTRVRVCVLLCVQAPGTTKGMGVMCEWDCTNKTQIKPGVCVPVCLCVQAPGTTKGMGVVCEWDRTNKTQIKPSV